MFRCVAVAAVWLCLFCPLALCVWGQNGYLDDRILMTDIKVLTFQKGKITAGKKPVSQLACIGPNCDARYMPSSVQCLNVGDDGYDVQWDCKADLDNAVRFGPLTVICEGYDNPEDPYVVRGSCQLEYTLERTSAGGGSRYSNSHSYDYTYSGEAQTTGWDLLRIFLAAVIIYLLWRTCIAPANHPNAHAAGGYPPAGGYGGGDYGHGSGGYGSGPYPPPGGPGYGGPGYGSGPNCGPAPSSGGGFWSGLATGGMLGYLFNRPRGYGYGAAPGYGYGGYGAGYGGGLGGGFGAPRTMGLGGGGMSSASSGGSRMASGYGGSRRR